MTVNYFADPWTPYWDHIEDGWKNRHHPNLHFQFYEDMNRVTRAKNILCGANFKIFFKDLSSTIRNMGKFLGKQMSNAQIDFLAEHLNIRNFRNNPAVNYDLVKEVGMLNSGEPAFIRKG